MVYVEYSDAVHRVICKRLGRVERELRSVRRAAISGRASKSYKSKVRTAEKAVARLIESEGCAL